MPELPEVETIMLGITPFLEGATITKVKLNRSDLRWPFPENFAKRLEKAKVLNLKRRSKYILVNLSTGETLLIHLGMSGKILVSNKKVKNVSKKTFSVLSSPEFLAEGTAIKDLENPDRVLIGGSDKFAINQLRDIYLRWIPEEKILLTNIWSSELSKLIANAFLAQRVSSINSISALCESTGADIKEVVKAIGSDKRIGNKFLSPGPGFGGSCFKKDILNLVYLCRFYKLDTIAEYWEQVMLINNWQKQRISALVVEKLYGTVSNKKILMLGFSFKSNTNDTRESPAIAIAKDLIDNGAELLVNDPKVTKNQIEKEIGIKELDIEEISYGKWEFVTDIYDASNGADAVILITDWDKYRNLNWEKISSLLRKPSWIFDTRGIISDDLLQKINSNFWQVGYPMTNS